MYQEREPIRWMGACLNCSEEATERYVLVLDGERPLAEGPLCGSCHAFFASADRIEVRDPAGTGRAVDSSDR